MLTERPLYLPAAFAFAMPPSCHSSMISRSHVATPARIVSMSVSVLVGLPVSFAAHGQDHQADAALRSSSAVLRPSRSGGDGPYIAFAYGRRDIRRASPACAVLEICSPKMHSAPADVRPRPEAVGFRDYPEQTPVRPGRARKREPGTAFAVQCKLRLHASARSRSPVQKCRAGSVPPLPFNSSLACLVRCCWGGQSMLCLSI
jgi:hypothetical protein